MEASMVDLRYKTKEILKALDRNETVMLLYHGKVKGKIVPVAPASPAKVDLSHHPLFGIRKDDTRSVEDIMHDLRKPRYRDI